ncbi:MAG: YcaO-like family protein [Candidatus Eremiobacteraeota bacterium]|nr:YcaO-like family protein [Candidatus Eremiobacteraeota bacterium]
MGTNEGTGVSFRGKVFRTPKKNPGSPRLMEPEEALELMKPFLRKTGLTRFAQITGLRSVGIPAVNAIRPISHNSSVTHGKGLTLAHALASAAGESIERYCWFNCTVPAFSSTYNDLKERRTVIPMERLALSRFSLFRPDLPEQWMLGWDLMHDEEVPVPFSSVSRSGTCFTTELRSFQSTSNGLAYGVDFLEALSQAIEEVVERDAVACMDMALLSGRIPLSKVRVDLSTIPFETIGGLIGKIEEAGLLPVLLDCTTDTAIPVYHCMLLDDKKCYVGSGASLSPETAMARAFTEAALAHAVLFSGVRDVYFRDERLAGSLVDFRKQMAESLEAPAERSARGLSAERTGSFEGDIAVMKDKLRGAGIDQLIVIDLPEPGLPGSVVKVTAPGLEGYHHTIAYRPGSRALSRMSGERP